MKYDKPHEIKKLIEQLLIPIDDIKMTETEVELFYDNISIGHLLVAPIFAGSVTIIKYIDDEASRNKLKWINIFKRNEATLTKLVREAVKDETVTLTPSVFRRLYIKVPGVDVQLFYECAFEKGAWRVYPI